MKKSPNRHSPKGKLQMQTLELWWICAELARFLATTDKQGFRDTCRVGERYVDAILENIRREKTHFPELEDAECFLECEGWGWAKKIWLLGEGDDGLALETATAYLQKDGYWETRMTQEELLAWRCLEAARSFDHSGKELSRATTDAPYPPRKIQDSNVAALWSFIRPTADKHLSNTPDLSSDITEEIVRVQQSDAFAAWRKWLHDNKKKAGTAMAGRFSHFRDAWASTNGRRWEPAVKTINLERFKTLWESYETSLRRGSNERYPAP